MFQPVPSRINELLICIESRNVEVNLQMDTKLAYFQGMWLRESTATRRLICMSTGRNYFTLLLSTIYSCKIAQRK